jgi:hypothetical protein
MAKKKTARRQVREKGPVRVPLGGRRAKLQLSEADQKEFKKRGVVGRWMNDEGGRISAALAAGYRFTDPKYATSLGLGAIHEGNTDEGSRVSKIVTRPNGADLAVRGFLMEIPIKFWKEDQALKEERNQEVDKALNLGEGGTEQNQYGTGVTFSH